MAPTLCQSCCRFIFQPDPFFVTCVLFSLIFFIHRLLQASPLCLLHLLRTNPLGTIVAAWHLCGKTGWHTLRRAFYSITVQSTLKTMSQRRGHGASVYQSKQLASHAFFLTSKSHPSSPPHLSSQPHLSSPLVFLTFLEHLDGTAIMFAYFLLWMAHRNSKKLRLFSPHTHWHAFIHIYAYCDTG